MAQDTTTLAQVFLGFGGNTLYTLGTACTAMGVIYGIHRITSLGIKVFSGLPQWLNVGNVDKNTTENTALITRKQLFDEASAYSKISVLIVFGVFIKMAGAWLSRGTTIDTFNELLYGK